MKIHEIKIGQYQQFKQLNIDLTYPKGHPSAGKPLDKICLIGRGGTGKSTLLQLIKYFITHDPAIGRQLELDARNAIGLEMSLKLGREHVRKYRSHDGFFVSNLRPTQSYTWHDEFKRFYNSYVANNRPILINYPSDVLAAHPIGQYLYPEYIPDVHFANEFDTRNLAPLSGRDYLDFATQIPEKLSQKVLHRINIHARKETEWQDRIREASQLPPKPGEESLKKITLSFERWKSKNPNPLSEMAQRLDGLLATYGVRINTTIDSGTSGKVGNIQLQTLQGIDLEPTQWSGGTKKIVEIACSLHESSPENAIILIDEPEKSLYPDVQSKIVDLYTSLTTDCQFFYATHSPIVAASFDPWEIVELKWDPTHQFVVHETNYLGDRHVDNYTVYPKYLRWDRILMNLFDLKEEGNSKFRQEELLNAVMLKHKIEAEVAAGRNKGPEFKQMVEKFEALSNKLEFYE